MTVPSARGVGSNGTQPALGNHSSGQAWASWVVTCWTVLSTISPEVKPTATREGTPTWRAIMAMAMANCSQ